MSRVSNKPYFVYVLWSDHARRFYIGISEDPHRRFQQHNEAMRGWSARYAPWKLVYWEEYQEYSQARRREIELKRQKSGGKFYEMTGVEAKDHPRKRTPSGS